MDDLAKAHEARRSKAAAQRQAEEYLLAWRGGGSEVVIGRTQAAERLGIKPQSLLVQISKSSNAYSLTRTHPVTGEPDVLTVSRIHKLKEKVRRGRPRKQQDLERLYGSGDLA